MQIQTIALDDLLVNRANDRHGELMDEGAAIEWLLTHRATHMRNLTKDIVQSHEIYEPPLVHEKNGKFVIYDGNRRTSVLKLLSAPERAPSQDWAQFFRDYRTQWQGDFPTVIECQVETDRARLDEILYRRHTGQQNGVGQSQWGAEAKLNFQKRTGKHTKIDIAEEIEKLLHTSKRLSEEERIPRSNMKRLLSAEQFRNRVGISIEKNKLKFTHSEEKVLDSLERISRDLITKKVTLDDIWDNEAKRLYLDTLACSGVLPLAQDALPEKIDSKPKRKIKIKPKPKEKKPSTPKTRKSLIRDYDFGLVQTHHNRRALDIFNELQHRLKFEEHDNAIAVLFRVLLELSIEIYIDRSNVSIVHKGDRLTKKYEKVLDHMLQQNEIDRNYHGALKKFVKSEPVFSTNTLHAYVHSTDFFPSDHHLKNMWDTLEKYILI